jgi:glucose/arabinose dehydrogenase
MPPLRVLTRAFALVAATFLAASVSASAAPSLTPLGTFDQPDYVTAPPGDPHRVFVVERKGTVRIVKDGTALLDPFLDISSFDMRRTGLASLAFPPDYATSGWVYVLYSKAVDDNSYGVTVELDAFQRKSTNPDEVDPASKQVILSLDFINTHDHDADHIEFGPDGHLYLTVGEGADDYNLAQDPNNNSRGKILRINPHPGATPAYTIPPGNPFVNGGGAPEVFAYGLRNPWRFSFDAQHRQVVIADVGDNTLEEVDVLNIDTGGGENLGWPCFEGTMPHNNDVPCMTPPAQTQPVFEYDHSTNNRCSIIGGYVGRDQNVPELFGRYVYGDFCSGEIRSIALGSTAKLDRSAGVQLPPFGLASFGEDGCGHLYVTHQSALSGGNVWRIDDGPLVPCPEPQKPPPITEPPSPITETPPPTMETPPPDVTPPDKTPPRLRLTRARLQNVIRSHRIVVGARCNEPCMLTASARFRHAAMTAAQHFQPISRQVPAGRSPKLVLHVTPKALKELRRVARRGRRALVRVEVRARDAAGNLARATCYIAAR